jgi:hypothetical protein
MVCTATCSVRINNTNINIPDPGRNPGVFYFKAMQQIKQTQRPAGQKFETTFQVQSGDMDAAGNLSLWKLFNQIEQFRNSCEGGMHLPAGKSLEAERLALRKWDAVAGIGATVHMEFRVSAQTKRQVQARLYVHLQQLGKRSIKLCRMDCSYKLLALPQRQIA